MTKFRAIPKLPQGLDPQTRAVLAALKENFEVLAGQRGGSGNPVADLLGYEPAKTTDIVAPAGAVLYFARATPPNGWLACDGAAVSRVQLPELFEAIGVTYGAGDGTTTFNLPDLRGEFIRGLDSGRGVDSGRALGTFQQGSHIAGDNGLTPAVVGIGNLLGQNNVDSADGASRDLYHTSTGVTVEADTTAYWGRVRPRNVALLACISAGRLL